MHSAGGTVVIILMRIPSRSFVVSCASLAAIFVVAAIAVASFTMASTPNVFEVLHYEDGLIVRRESKGLHLYGPVAFQFVGLGMLIYLTLHWDRFVKDAIGQSFDFNERHGRKVDVGWGLRFVISGIVGSVALALFIVIFNSYRLL